MGRVHADNLANRVGSAQLVAVADAIEPLASSVAARYGVRWSTSLEELVADPELDGVVIGAPSALHPELVAVAATAGKHVFCEKPLGLDVEACRGAAAAARAAGVELQVGFQRRFDPEWRALRSALDSGALGNLDLFRCSHRNARLPAAAAELGDVFVDVAIHDLDAARWLAGDVEEVYAATSADGTSATLVLLFERGALGLIDVNRRAGYGFDCCAELVGSAGTARCGYAQRRGAELLRDGRASAPLAQDHAEHHRVAYVAELEHFGELALGDVRGEVDGDTAVAALQLAQLAARSAALGVPVAVRGDPVATR
jgi:predicted dehydrogenase